MTEKLNNYKINQITIKSKDNSFFEFYVDYSVQPIKLEAWLIANRKQSGDWINNQSYFVKVSINKDVYSIEDIGHHQFKEI